MRFTTTLTTLAVLATSASALVEDAGAGHGAGVARRNHPLGQSFVAAVEDAELDKRAFEVVKRTETAA